MVGRLVNSKQILRSAQICTRYLEHISSFLTTIKVGKDQELKQPQIQQQETTKTANMQNTKRTHGQPSEQLFPKKWSLSNPNRTKSNLITKNRQQRFSEPED